MESTIPAHFSPTRVPRKKGRIDRYSLRFLIMFVSSVTVAFGIVATSPGMGILLLVVTLLAGLRALSLVERLRERGRVPDAGQQMWLLACSFAVVILISTAPVGSAAMGLLLGRQLGMAREMGSGHVMAGFWEGLFLGLGLGVLFGLNFGYRALHCWLTDSEIRDTANWASIRTAVTPIVSSRRLSSYSLVWLTMLFASAAVVPSESALALGIGSLLGAMPILFWLRFAELAYGRHRRNRIDVYQFLQTFGVALTLVAVVGFVAVTACLLGYLTSLGTV